MVIFLTSSPTGPLDGSRKVNGLDKKNYFVPISTRTKNDIK